MSEYRAGVCNINSVETKKRKIMGAVSLVNALLLTAVLFIFPSFTPLFAGIFILFFTGVLGFLQSRQKFCAGLALKNKFHTGDTEQKVENPEKASKDRKKAASIIVQSLIFSSLLTAAIYIILPHI